MLFKNFGKDDAFGRHAQLKHSVQRAIRGARLSDRPHSPSPPPPLPPLPPRSPTALIL
jgi:hypothetical protein